MNTTIMDSVIDNIGNTPLIRLSRLGTEESIKCELLAKCEFYNAGGSVKDRIGKRMIIDAEKNGKIKPGDILIEPTSGNTGIGIALTAAIKGYHMIATMPEKMSSEKVDVLKVLGANIIRTPDDAPWNSSESHIGVAQSLNTQIENSYILNQYENPSNVLAHYEGTAEEILKQCDGKLDVFVAGAGTGGTLTGIGKKLKEKLPNIKIIGVDPIGSILAQPDEKNEIIKPYKVEGIGYDFIPQSLDRSIVDEWVKTDDAESFYMARRLIMTEGLLCGGSSGSAVVAAIKVAKKLKENQRCVVILPDSIRNYISKFVNDGWMEDSGFSIPLKKFPNDYVNHSKNSDWDNQTVSSLKLPIPVTITDNQTCGEAIDIMKDNGFDQLPVVSLSSTDEIVGVATLSNIMNKISSGRINRLDIIKKVVYDQFICIQLSTKLSRLINIFEKHAYCIVIDTNNKIVSICTRIDLLDFIAI